MTAVASNPRATLLEQLRGYQVTSLLYVAAKLGVPDLLGDQPRRSEQLASQVGVDASALHRMLRGLVLIGVLAEEADGHFTLTAAGRLLQRDHPESLWNDAVLHGEFAYQTFGALLETVRTGKSGVELISGKGLFEYLAAAPELGSVFNGYMSRRTRDMVVAILNAYAFPPGTIVDVGGGIGVLLRAVLEATPEARGILVDLPSVIDRAQATFGDGLADRCDLNALDFFDHIPPGGDCYLVKHVLHDWDDAACITLLRNCRRAMSGQARLLVIEAILPERATDAPDAIWLDLRMLTSVGPGSRERTAAEYQALLEQAGFDLHRIIPTSSEVSILEATPMMAA